MNKAKRRAVYCLTPTKNEGWIIEHFLKAASIWADKIIIADQQSTDNTISIAKQFSKVVVIKNQATTLNEIQRQTLLINESRKSCVDKILVSLDADEFFTPNFTHKEWEYVINSPVGSSFNLHMYNILPHMKKMWQFTKVFPLIYVDDGVAHVGNKIHTNRLPTHKGNIKTLKTIKVMHFQYYDQKRNEHKSHWYQAWEAINHPMRHPIDVFRQYHHHMSNSIICTKIPDWWITGYENKGVDFRTIKLLDNYWWDRDITKWLIKYGKNKFRYCDIGQLYADSSVKRNVLIKYLYSTQPYYPNFLIPRFDNFLKRFYV